MFTLQTTILSCSALADEAHIEVYGGSAGLQDEYATDIRMDSETVRIALGHDDYTVDATFVFFNEGVTTTVAVGFPEFAEGYFGHRGGGAFAEFQTWVNGVERETEQIPGKIIWGDQTYSPNSSEKPWENGYNSYAVQKWRVKNVNFPAAKSTLTRVRYSAPYGHPFNTVAYLYGTGRSWKGTIGSAQFVIKSTPETWIHNFRFGKWPDGGRHAGYTLSRISEYECEIRLRDIKPGLEDSLRNLCWQLFSRDDKQPWENLEVGLMPPWQYSSKELPEEMLDMLSSWQLRMLRNTFFAIHGKAFSSADLQKYFQGMWATEQRPIFKESDLTDTERINVSKVLAYERKNKRYWSQDAADQERDK